MSGRAQSALPLAVVVLCVLAVTVPLAMAPVARAAARASISQDTATEDIEQVGVAATPQFTDLGVRQVPLLSEEIGSEIGNNPPKELVKLRISEIRDGLGLADLDLARLLGGNKADLTAIRQYTQSISDEFYMKHETEVLDLAALYMIEWANGWQSAYPLSNVAAYGLYERVAQVSNSCDAQMSYAYVRSLTLLRVASDDYDPRPRFSNSLAMLTAPESPCGEDPTVLWLVGNLQLDYSLYHTFNPVFAPLESDLKDAVATFERLVELYPDSPAGYLGRAEVLVRAAEINDAIAMRPFTARSYWERAAGYFSDARERTSAGEVTLFHAYTLARAGKTERAVENLAGVDRLLLESNQRAAKMAQDIYYRAGEYKISAMLEPPNNLPTREVVAYNGGTDARALWGFEAGRVGLLGAGGRMTSFIGFVENGSANPTAAAMSDEAFAACLQQKDCGDLVPAFVHAGQFDRALQLAESDIESAEEQSDRRFISYYYNAYGDVLLHANRPLDAVTQFEIGAARALDGDCCRPREINTYAMFVLKLGYAMQMAGDLAAAEALYEQVPGALQHPKDRTIDNWGPEQVMFFTNLLLGEVHLAQERYQEALAEYLAAQEYAATAKFPYLDNGVAASNAALAAVQLKEYDIALEQAEIAVALDPESPIFLETLADVSRRSEGSSCGEIDDAISTYRRILAADDSSAVVWNNLGVALAGCGFAGEASDAFRASVRANPQYAKGWFNLGSHLLMQGSWSDFLVAQGALGIAGSLDDALRGKGPGVTADDDIYESGLDLSKPLPPNLELGQLERRSVMPFTILLIALVAARLVAALLKDLGLGNLAERIIAGVGSGFPYRVLPAILGALISATLLVWLSPSVSKERWVLVPIAVGAVALPSAIRAATGRAGKEATPVPILLGSALLAPFGIALPPLPTARHGSGPWRAVALVGVGGLVMLALLVARLAPVPLERATMLVLVAVLTTMLLPMEPYDGSRLGKVGSGLATIGLAGIATLLALNWI